jgi:hypothetical protein
MMEAAPTSSLEMPKPDLLLELLIITLDAPAHFSKIDQTGEADVLRQRRKPILRRLVLGVAPVWPDTRLPGLSTNELPGGSFRAQSEDGSRCNHRTIWRSAGAL